MDAAPLPPLPAAPYASGWAAALASAPEPVAAAWLARADRARDLRPEEHLAACEVYRALAPAADPSDPAWGARVQHLVHHDPRRDDVFLALAERWARTGPPEVAPWAAAVVAECAASRYDLGRAEGLFMDQLARERGRGTALERRLCGSLAEMYRWTSRHFEVLFLVRRALAVTDPPPRARERAVLWFRRADALAGLGDLDAAEAALGPMAEALDELPPAAEVVLRRRLVVQRVRLAGRRGDVATADRWLAELDRLWAVPAPDGADPRWCELLHAGIDLRAGRVEAAAARLAAADRVGHHVPGADPVIQALVDLAVVTRDVEGARAAGRRMLEVVETRLDELGTGNGLDWASACIDVYTDVAPDPELARRAFDAAGRTVLRRIQEVDDAMQRLPELSAAEAEDRAYLVASRVRFQEEQARLLEGVGRFLATHFDERRDALARLAGDDALVRLCAWCRRMAMPDGAWRPVGHYLPRGGPLRLTHGICPDCLATVRATPFGRAAGLASAGPPPPPPRAPSA